MSSSRCFRLRRSPFFVVPIVYLAAFVSTFGASIPVGFEIDIISSFQASSTQRPFLVAAYLMGSAIGPLLYSPLSERYGRRWCMILGAALMAIFTSAVTKAPNWEALCIFRFLAGLGSSAAMNVSSGIIADIMPNPAIRGLLSCWLMVVTTVGPLVASTVSLRMESKWTRRWDLCFWVNSGATLLTLVAVAFLPETLEKAIPATLKSASRPEEKASIGMLTRFLLPFRMITLEPIVTVTCLFLSLVYAIFYLFFQLLPVLFVEVYGLSDAAQMIIFIPLAVGSILAGLIYTFAEPLLRALSTRPGGANIRQPELRRLPPASVGGFLVVVALFVAGHVVSKKDHHVYVLLAEGAFGLGFLLIFMGLTNYIVDAYKTAVVSALAPSFVIRNLIGAGFLFAADPLYARLGPMWELYMLGLLSLPFACLVTGTLYFGPSLRSSSKMLQSLED